MDLNQEISNRIRELRIAKDLTQEQLAERIEWDASFQGRIERGKSNNLQINTLDKIITALDTDYTTFFSFSNSSDRAARLVNNISNSQNSNTLLQVMEDIIKIDQNNK